MPNIADFLIAWFESLKLPIKIKIPSKLLTSLNISVLETEINNIPLSGIDTVSAINPVVTKFKEEQQTKFTQYYENIKAKYATYYGNFDSTINGNNLKTVQMIGFDFNNS